VQVNDILKHDSAQPLIDGQNVGPLIELDFWSSKMKNLEGIQDQLMSDAVQHIKVVLAESRSSYTPVLEKVITDVQTAYAECQKYISNIQAIAQKQGIPDPLLNDTAGFMKGAPEGQVKRKAVGLPKYNATGAPVCSVAGCRMTAVKGGVLCGLHSGAFGGLFSGK